MAHGDDSCIVVLAHAEEVNEVCVEDDEHSLGHAQDEQLEAHAGQGPQFHGNDGHGNEQAQGEVPNGIDAFVQGGMVSALLGIEEQTNQDACKHAAYVDRERDVQGFQYGEEGTAQTQGKAHQVHGLDDIAFVHLDTHGGFPGCFFHFTLPIQSRIFQVMFPDDETAERPTDDGTGNQAEGSCRDGCFHSVPLTELDGDRSKSCCVAVAASHRDGTGHHSQQRRHGQDFAQAQSDHVLDGGQDGSGNAEQDHVFPAGLQQAQAGSSTAGGKEDAVEQAVGHFVIELQFTDTGIVKQ